MEHGQSNEAGEPEEHGQRIEHEDGDERASAREPERGKAEEESDHKGPYGTENHEIDFIWDVDKGDSVPPMRDYEDVLLAGSRKVTTRGAAGVIKMRHTIAIKTDGDEGEEDLKASKRELDVEHVV